LLASGTVVRDLASMTTVAGTSSDAALQEVATSVSQSDTTVHLQDIDAYEAALPFSEQCHIVSEYYWARVRAATAV
jgi:hypothetical protein